MSGAFDKKKSNPWKDANIFSRLIFWWVTPIIQLGNKRALRVKDLYNVLPEDESEKLGLELERAWLKELDKKNSKKKPSFARALMGIFGASYVLPGLQTFIDECVVKIGQPFCLSQLINYFNEDSDISLEFAYLYASGVVLGSALTAFNYHSRCFKSQYIATRVRVATCSLVFRKSLRLSQKALGETTIGQMINIISNDVGRFDLLFPYLHYLWVGPLAMIITTALLYYVIGLASLVGLVVLFILVPVQLGIGKSFTKLRQEASKRTDDRIRTVNEVIPAMRVIKMYAWEMPFLKLTQMYRKIEMKVIRKNSHLRAFNTTLSYISAKLVVFPILIVLVFSGSELTPSKAFLIVALFNNIRLAIPQDFSIAIQQAAETRVSIQRIEEFLLLDENNSKSKHRLEKADSFNRRSKLKRQSARIEIHEVAVKWPVSSSENEENTLSNINFKVQSGQMLTIVGKIGSGKSTLLNAILGELPTLKGSLFVDGKIAYCSQEPWIITGTIRQNILCGLSMDPERYYRVLRAAALEQDFKQLPQGDSSIIGEGGISLSGGQKARVNLARCLYVDADIYLLDDPLSAVDTHVGAHIFQKAIKGFLHGKIRILVTHHLQHLKGSDQILLLNERRVEFYGLFKEFQKKGLGLTKIGSDDVFGEDSSDEELVSPLSKEFKPIWETSHQKYRSDESASSIRKKSLLKYARRQSRRQTGSTSSTRQITWKRESSKIQARRSLMNHIEEPIEESKDDESSENAGVSFATYWKYFRSGSSVFSFILFVFCCILAEVLFYAADYWLNLWTEAEHAKWSNFSLSSTLPPNAENFSVDSQIKNAFSTKSNDDWVLDTNTGIYVYSILIAGVIVFGYIRAAHFYSICMGASTKLHGDAFNAVLRAPILFFDQNPVGRIVNRFSKDTGTMDDTLPTVMFDTIWIGMNSLGAIATVAIVNYWLIIPAFVLGIVFFLIRKSYLKVALGIKRLEANTKSPVFTQLYSSLIGLTTLRAHGCQGYFQKDFDRYQDVHSSSWFLVVATARWLGFWLDMVFVTFVGSVTYACVAFSENLSSGEAGLIISAAMSMIELEYGIRQSAEMMNQMTSVDRVIEYGRLPSEAPLESSKDKKPPPNWPSSGIIQLNNLTLRYSITDPPVLKNLNCTINSCEKIGIVGRSGAGKSSVIAALFRLTEPDGSILIDGIDFKALGLHDLRSKISIIPQEPTLFSGSLRTNLDPFGVIGDDVLWAAIKDVHLDLFMTSEYGASEQSLLDFYVSEGGVNLSVGQRQLICLARAILRDNRILVLDEITASVDKETDKFIQMIIRDKFGDCTVLTIAHRLNTIIDSDKIMVLDAGQISEYDSPAQLLGNSLGIFRSLVDQTGEEEATELLNLAKMAFEAKNPLAQSTALLETEKSVPLKEVISKTEFSGIEKDSSDNEESIDGTPL